MTHDAVVIGAGLSGLTAALRLADEGMRVVVLATGVGSLHLGGSTIDVLGYDDSGIVESPARALPDLVAARPGHPYSKLQDIRVVEDALGWLKDKLTWCRYVGNLEENFLLPSAAGAARPTAVVPETMAAGDVRKGGRFAIATLPGLKDLFPSMLADNLTQAPVDGTVEARGLVLEVEMGGDADVGPLRIARLFELPEWRKQLVKELAAHLRPDEDVGFPAVLGLARARDVWADLEQSLGRRVFEVPTLPPCVPGIRAYNDLTASLRGAGGRIVVKAPVTGFDATGGRITRVYADLDYRRAAYDARWFVLATGGVMTGGIELDSHRNIREKVFDLPVSALPSDGPPYLPGYFEDHPMDAAGVEVDEAMRPLRGGEVVYENLRAAGATLAGAAPWKEKSGNGISLATGYAAAGSILDAERVP
jgi:glycerol-3-phosphate dehydrogenase subunit B